MIISSFPASQSSASRQHEFSSRSWLLICALVAAIWFLGLGFRPLLSPDEGRYAEIAREMSVTNDFVTPRLNGLKYFEKPPLHYWLTAFAFKLFGESETTARLVPALYGLGIAIAIYGCLLRLHDRATAQRGFLLATGSCWIVAMSHFIALDIGLTFWLTVCLCGLLGCIERFSAERLTAERHSAERPSADPINQSRVQWPDYWVWIGVAGAFLSKGLVGGLIPVAALGMTIMLSRRWRLIGAVRWFPGFFIFLALILPWLVWIQLENPNFFEFFFIREHFQRFTTKMHQRVEPWWFFLPVLLMGGLPWLGHWLGVALSRRLRSDSNLLLLAWSVFTLVFFSLSGSKLPSYILPIFPAMALWLARTGGALSVRALRLASLVPLMAVVLAMALVYLQFRSPSEPLADSDYHYLPWIIAAALSLGIGALLSWTRSQHGFLAALTPLALAMLLATQCLQWGHASLAERFSSQGLAQRLLATESNLAANTPIFSVGTYDQTLPFYLKRTLTLVDYRDEMDMGLLAEPEKNGPQEAALLQRWPTMPLAYAVLDHRLYERWQALGVPLREVARNERRVVVANR
jgi:4-amino-4-deoxy-L-arabinose transferase-like glycosyltransferase